MKFNKIFLYISPDIRLDRWLKAVYNENRSAFTTAKLHCCTHLLNPDFLDKKGMDGKEVTSASLIKKLTKQLEKAPANASIIIPINTAPWQSAMSKPKLLDFLGDYTQDIELIALTPAPLNCLEMKVQQSILSGSSASIIDLVNQHIKNGIYHDILSWAHAFAPKQCKVVSYDYTKTNGLSLMTLLLKNIGYGQITKNLSMEPKGMFEYPGLQGTLLLHALNQSSPEDFCLIEHPSFLRCFCVANDHNFHLDIRLDAKSTDLMNKDIQSMHEFAKWHTEPVNASLEKAAYPTLDVIEQDVILSILNALNGKISRLKKALSLKKRRFTLPKTIFGFRYLWYRLTNEIPPKQKINKLYLHIGTMKTGTTSLQNLLQREHEMLQSYGLYYPAKFHPHNTFFHPIFSTSEKDRVHNWKPIFPNDSFSHVEAFLLHKWKKYLSTVPRNSTVIISSEGTSFWSHRAVLRFKHFASQYFDEVNIVAYVREPESLINSRVQQAMRLRPKDTVGQIIRNLIENQLYRFPRAWMRNFDPSRIHFRVFNKNCFKNGNLIDDFFSMIGFDAITSSSFSKIKKHNASLGAQGAYLAYQYNLKFPEFINKKVNRKRKMSGTFNPDLYASKKDEKFSIDLQFDQRLATRLNRAIDNINPLIANGHIGHVRPSVNGFSYRVNSVITLDYSLDVIKNHLNYIFELQQKKANLSPASSKTQKPL
ncbi:MAG: hypothetical protein AB1Z19_04100 [Eubacteriales bacterium]